MGRNERGRLKAERDYNAKNNLQRCVVCGRWFIKRKEAVCSRDCAAKLAQSSHEVDVDAV